MKLLSVHVCMEVASFHKAMEFYAPLFQVAGFTKSMSDDATYAGYRNEHVTLFIGESSPRRVTRQRPSGDEFVVTDHVGFSVSTKADVFAIEAAMRKAGHVPLFPAQEYPEFGPGFFAVTFCDLDNNIIEFGHRVVPAGATPPVSS